MTKTSVALLVLVLLAGGCARGPRFGFVRPGLPLHAEVRAAFLALDTSGNGGITLEEWRSDGDTRFWRRDRDGDGYLTTLEIGDNAMMFELFVHADQRADGRLERREFGRLRELIFQDADLMNDGSLVFIEYELLMLLRRSGWTDTSGYGRILPTQLHVVLEKSMPLLDRNRDGVLHGRERGFFSPAHLEIMDPRGTGRIDLEQIYRGYRFLLGFDFTNGNL